VDYRVSNVNRISPKSEKPFTEKGDKPIILLAISSRLIQDKTKDQFSRILRI